MERKLVAVLAADLIGFSRLMGEDEIRTLTRLKSLRADVIDPKISAHKGRIFKTTGDGFLAEFVSVVSAVACAQEIQRAMHSQNDGVPHEHQFTLRIGINLGDVVVDGDDIFGDGVNIASRLEGLSPPGGIAVSAVVRAQVNKKLDITFEDIGDQQLKNIVPPVRVFVVTPEGVPASDWNKAIVAKSGKPSIAVLPFTNMSGDVEQQYFSDGITEDIITELSRFRSLFVIARNSSFQYREKAVDIRQISRELGVQYIVEGSVRRIGPRIRITVQLIESETGNHVWSERYDKEIQDLFAVQDEVVRTVVATLIGRVEDAEIRGSANRRTEILPAYDALLQGIERLRGYDLADNRKARELFERAVALDPQFGLAHSYLGIALILEHGLDRSPQPVKDRALNEANLGVRLEPNESRCQQFLGQVRRFRREFDLAIGPMTRGVELNPNDATAIAQLGGLLGVCGEPERGIELIHEAMRLNPFHPDWYWIGLSTSLFAARQYEQSLQALRKLPSTKSAYYVAREAACLAQLGRMAEAKKKAAIVLDLRPDFSLQQELPVYKNAADSEHLLNALRKAGLPE